MSGERNREEESTEDTGRARGIARWGVDDDTLPPHLAKTFLPEGADPDELLEMGIQTMMGGPIDLTLKMSRRQMERIRIRSFIYERMQAKLRRDLNAQIEKDLYEANQTIFGRRGEGHGNDG